MNTSLTPRRVVITGIGLITPLGLSAKDTWQQLAVGQSGVTSITRFDASLFSTQIAAEVKNFDPKNYIHPKEIKKMGLFIQYGMASTLMALADAGLPTSFENFNQTVGVNMSAGMGGLPEIQYWDRELVGKTKKVTSPFFVPMIIPNLLSGQISILTKAQGPNLCIVTACASSSHAIGEAYRMIQNHTADIMITGGAEAVICELGVAGFASMKALSSRNDQPQQASRPYDKDRDGFVLGEGAGCLILENEESARKRNAKIYGEVIGYGLSADAYHMTTPAPEAKGALRCMKMALAESKLDLSQIDYINAHGTSTPQGDAEEASAIAELFANQKNNLHVSSTKSMTGHLLGAAGAVEAIFCLQAMQNSLVPPTINLNEPDPKSLASGLNFTANQAVAKKIRRCLSNSFGFGGTNASLIFGEYQP